MRAHKMLLCMSVQNTKFTKWYMHTKAQDSRPTELLARRTVSLVMNGWLKVPL